VHKPDSIVNKAVGMYVPALQLEQLELPLIAEKKPAEQVEQDVAPAAEYIPAEQTEVHAEVAPVAVE